jgi:hypothetical protein
MGEEKKSEKSNLILLVWQVQRIFANFPGALSGNGENAIVKMKFSLYKHYLRRERLAK